MIIPSAFQRNVICNPGIFRQQMTKKPLSIHPSLFSNALVSLSSSSSSSPPLPPSSSPFSLLGSLFSPPTGKYQMYHCNVEYKRGYETQKKGKQRFYHHQHHQQFKIVANPPPKTGFSRAMMGGLLVGTLLGFFTLPGLLEKKKKGEEEEEGEEIASGSAGTSKDGTLRKLNDLTDIRQSFEQFADAEKDGELYMTPRAFVMSLISPRPITPSWVAYPRVGSKLAVDDSVGNDPYLQALLGLADPDSDGVISYEEYCFVISLLSCNEKQSEIAFLMFDTNGDGVISPNEFYNILKASSRGKLGSADLTKSSIMKHLFGKNMEHSLTFESFRSFLKDMKESILRQEFNYHDVERRGLISIEAFSELMTTSTHFNSLQIPEFKRHLNLLRTRGFFKPNGRIDYQTFRAFHMMSEHIDDISTAIALYGVSGKPLDKKAFKRALQRVAHLSIDDHTVDLVFAIFDTNGDGSIDYEEMVEIMKRRKPLDSVSEINKE